MALRRIGKTKIRDSHVKWKGRGEVTLEVTVPKEVKLFFPVRHGTEVEVSIDEENKLIIYKILEGCSKSL